jgi:hypothetical protein
MGGSYDSMVTSTMKDYGPSQAATRVGLSRGDWARARAVGLVPDPDVAGGRWSAAVVEDLAGRAEALVDELGPPPLGANRAAGELAARTGLEVVGADVELLAARGLVAERGEYQGWTLYDRRDLDGVPVEAVAAVMGERQAWRAGTCNRFEAAEHLGCGPRDVGRLVESGRLVEAAGGRYQRAQVESLRVDGDAAGEIDRERLLGPEQAAARLEVRRVDWDYVVAAGWVAPREYSSMRVGHYRHVEVPLYRAGDIDAVAARPDLGVDWDEVRAAPPGSPSPLRAWATRPPSRARVVRRWVARVAARWATEVWGLYRGSWDHWEIDWTVDPDGHPTRDELVQALAEDPDVADHRDAIVIGTAAGAAVRWAREMLTPGAAVVLDTETTDLWGAICEIAVLDTDGTVLLDSLVNPGMPITDEARAIHGISDEAVADAPTWPEILPRLLAVTEGRQILAYNADYDANVITTDCQTHRLDPGPLAEPGRWGCIMDRRSDWARTTSRFALNGPHGALGDTYAALEVLHTMTGRQGHEAPVDPAA